MKKIFTNAKFKKFSSIFMIVCVLMSVFCVGVSAADTGVSDLAGTTWTINSLNVSSGFTKLTFTSPICSIDSPSHSAVLGDYVSIHLGYGYDDEPASNKVLLLTSSDSEYELSVGDVVTFYESSASTNSDLIDFLEQNATLRVEPVTGEGTLEAILDIALSVGSWIVFAAFALVSIFWTGEELTFLGVLAVAALAFSVAFLIIGLIQNFLHFRG